MAHRLEHLAVLLLGRGSTGLHAKRGLGKRQDEALELLGGVGALLGQDNELGLVLDQALDVLLLSASNRVRMRGDSRAP